VQLPSKVGENTWNTGVMQVEVGKIYQKTGKSTSFWWFHTVYSAIGRQTQCNCLQIHAFPANIREQGNTRQMQAIRSSFKIYLISGKSTKNLPDFGNLRHFTVQLPTKHSKIRLFTGNMQDFYHFLTKISLKCGKYTTLPIVYSATAYKTYWKSIKPHTYRHLISEQ